ncbi:transglycosylase SLT domain-containing protein [Pseudomonas sp. GD03860]|uniref:lytic transglycosylase domain-containing protein n=2 Tax=Pseudomonas TaxID=286 RepID=UPI00210F00F2|nr:MULTISPECIES: transglycosylase SLT domain-containing protein [unclassified Pseudomonas]MDH0640112.1 transglycosylase SLT domain-containing protein [Pseudomonas sp. GD03860]
MADASSRRFTMRKLPKFTLALLASVCASAMVHAEDAQPTRFSELAAKCAPTVHPSTLKALIGNESTFNPYAIGVVGTHLQRQPQSLSEAIATAEQLERDGKRYAMGLGQLLVTNMRARGLSYQDVFEPCRNLQAISNLLVEYYKQALTTSSDKQEALLKAFSMYYSGNELRGFRPDRPGEMSYVEKVVHRALNPTAEDPIVPAVEGAEGAEPIAVVAASAPVRKAPQRARRASEQQEGPWLTFTDDNGQAVAVAKTETISKPQIQVHLNTDAEADISKREFKPFDQPAPQHFEQAEAQPVAEQQQATPSFVQIIN